MTQNKALGGRAFNELSTPFWMVRRTKAWQQRTARHSDADFSVRETSFPVPPTAYGEQP